MDGGKFLGKPTKQLRDYSIPSNGGSKAPSNGEGNKSAFFKLLITVCFFPPGQMKKSLQSSSAETVRHLTLMS